MDKVWLKQYQEGVPHEINYNNYTSLVDLFNQSCEKFQNNSAFINRGSHLTYKQLHLLSGQFAVYLQTLGLKPGARVAIMLPNLLQYPVVMFGALRAGLIVVNTNPLYTSEEVSYQLNDSGAEVLIVLANFAYTIEKALPHLTSLKHIVITEIGDLYPKIKRCVINLVVKYIKKMVPTYNIPQAITLHKALSLGVTVQLNPVAITHESLAFLQYTGGTTGVSKGAMLTHGNLIANVLQASAWITPLHMGPKDIIVTALPLYHIFSLTANCLVFLNLGAQNILITNPRDTAYFIKEIKKSGFTAISGVNTLFNTLLHNSKFDEIDFSHVKLILSGGMALQRSVATKWYEKTKLHILEAYGLTEASPAVSINPLYIKEFNGSIGIPLPSTEISIRNDDGAEVAIGEPGELCVKGPQVMPGYWQRNDESELVFWPDGFLRTGDIVTVDINGFLTLVDRKKEMILVSGFNVYPNEIEQVISILPGVAEVGVVGVLGPDEQERVKACIVKRDASLTIEQVIAHCRAHLTSYKVPKIVEFYDDLPKTNVGKILRRALK